MESPGEDMVGLGPGSLGLEFEASAEVAVSGKNKNITLALQGDATVTKDFDVSEYAPPFLAQFDPVVIITGPDAHIRSSLGKTFPGGGPFELELTHQVWGGIQASAELNLRPITGKLPYVGPALTTLDRDELRLIDFDPNDGVTHLADVTPDGDFDGDGMSNAQELAFGYDPTDPSSVLTIVNFEVGDEAKATLYIPGSANGVLRRSTTVDTLLNGPHDIVEIRTNAVGILTLTDPSAPTNNAVYGVTLER
ncbi:MAG: hypothetical protein O3C57_06600 [Verrucomicrobia bacterium]|nr:hypothetical protein [Verrucomicrobiota bacterium]